MDKVKYIALNVRGVRDQTKRQAVFKWISNQKANICFLSETYITHDIVDNVNTDWTGLCYHSYGIKHAKGASRGVSILVKNNIPFTFLDEITSEDGRKLIVNCDIGGTKFSLISIYAPNSKKERVNFFADVKRCLNDIELHNIIMGGDFNTVVDKHLDKKGGLPAETHSSKALTKHLINHFNLFDPWRTQNPTKQHFTHKQVNPLILTRIDFWLVSKKLQTDIISSNIIPSIRTDHRAITFEFHVKQISKGKGFWRLNTSILDNKEYQNGIIELIDNVTKEYAHSEIEKRLLWDLLKIKCKEFSIKFSYKLSHERMSEVTRLQTQLEVIEKEMGFIEELIELNGNSNTNFKGLPYFYDVQVRNIEAVLIVVLRMTKRDD